VLHDGTTRLSLNGEPIFHYSGVSSFAEEVIVPATGAIKVRKDAPLDVIALVGCGVATGVGAVLNTAKVEPGASVVVIGCGGVGLSVVQGARIAGASTIIAVDLQGEKLEIASVMGATHTINARETDALEMIRRIAPNGVNYAFDAIGGTVTAGQCIAAIGVGGTAVMVGIPRQGTEATFEPQKLVDFDQRILGANYGGIVPSVDIPRLVDRYMNGELLLDQMISARRPLEDADAAIKDLSGGSPLRQLLVP
jgi:S-(hydroxymethyl)glutathione dehydrogenase/alcohol dehydrogenase